MRQVYKECKRRKFIAYYENSPLYSSGLFSFKEHTYFTCLYYHWKNRFEQYVSVVESDALLPQFCQIVMHIVNSSI